MLVNSSSVAKGDLASLLSAILGKSASPALPMVSSQSNDGTAPAASQDGSEAAWVTPGWVTASTDRIMVAQGQGAGIVHFQLSGEAVMLER